ncbi:hypothetical protein LSTR_LSTR010364 [Laodelphax striatellus]|uniref:Uncharacterized protein n=1 Tax=Laodelphax striatellus TaxID=195883 RepID=A0A482WKP2_LAOST|nr:hypothetical protein LSTR_LSTR010364 [Laodelphax striatellus]
MSSAVVIIYQFTCLSKTNRNKYMFIQKWQKFPLPYSCLKYDSNTPFINIIIIDRPVQLRPPEMTADDNLTWKHNKSSPNHPVPGATESCDLPQSVPWCDK